MTLLLLGVAMLPVGGILAFVAPRRIAARTFTLFAIAGALLVAPVSVGVLVSGGTLEAVASTTSWFGSATLAIDPLAALFSVVIALGAAFGGVYSSTYLAKLKHGEISIRPFYLFYGLLCGSMFMVVLLRNSLLFLFAWEIMSLSSFFLITADAKSEEARGAGIYYLVAMQIGAAFLMIGFSWAFVRSGSFSFEAFRTLPRTTGIFVFLLLFCGFSMKSGFVPLHTWLPKAHPAAPTPVSALMSGVMIKTGIYGTLRMIVSFQIHDLNIGILIFALGLVSGLMGMANAIAQSDLKRLLAYSSIENIGIIGMGIGLGVVGTATGNAFMADAGYLAALVHTFTHFTFKTLLFYGAGVVYSATGTRALDRLGGLIRTLPRTGVLFLIGSAAISGLPLLSGFAGEFAIFLGLVRGTAAAANGTSFGVAAVSVIGLAGLSLIGAMALLCFTKVTGVCFLGVPRSRESEPANIDQSLDRLGGFLTPMFSMALLVAGVGLAAPVVVSLLRHLVGDLTQFSIAPEWGAIIHAYGNAQFGLLLFAGLILFFLGLRRLLLVGKRVERFKTWDCGYQHPAPRMQFTASSYVSFFLGLTAGVVPERREIDAPSGLFPVRASLRTHTEDLVSHRIVDPITRLLQRALAGLRWIQSGRTQQYVLYGLLFLIILIVIVFGIRV